MKKYITLLIICGFIFSCSKGQKKVVDELPAETIVSVDEYEILPKIKVEFKSIDGLLISADYYEVKNNKRAILLCHQAGYSRGEYIETAKRLNSLGYSCLAIDQRSGNEVNNVENETAIRAKTIGLSTSYLDAKQDIEAAIEYLYDINGNKPIILVGSSYSASLVLLIGKENEKVEAVAAFSPGEYLKGIKMNERLQDYKKPVFLTSSRSEIEQVENLNLVMTEGFRYFFKPPFPGVHGSKALWDSTEDSDKYWFAFEEFFIIMESKKPNN